MKSVGSAREIAEHLRDAERSLMLATVKAGEFRGGGVHAGLLVRESYRRSVKTMLRVREMACRLESHLQRHAQRRGR